MLNRKPTARPRRRGNTNTGNRKHDAPSTANQSIASSSPDPAGGGLYEESKQEESPQEGVGRCQMIDDISNRLVLYLMDKQASKQNETPGHRPMRLVPRLVFFRLARRLVVIDGTRGD